MPGQALSRRPLGPFPVTSIETSPPTVGASPNHVSILTVDGAATFTAGPVTIGGTLGVTGLATFSGGLTVSAGPVTLQPAMIQSLNAVVSTYRDQTLRYDDFQRPDGALGTSVSGQAWVTSGPSIPTISGHKMVIPLAGSVGYAMLDNGVTPYQIGATYVFTAGTTDAVLAMICSPDPGIGLTNMVHFIQNTKTWNLSLWWPNNLNVSIGGGTFLTPLAADGATVYETVLTYDGPNNTVTIQLPDGTVTQVVDARITTQGLLGPRCILGADKLGEYRQDA